jgi:hypothetical protein
MLDRWQVWDFGAGDIWHMQSCTSQYLRMSDEKATTDDIEIMKKQSKQQ